MSQAEEAKVSCSENGITQNSETATNGAADTKSNGITQSSESATNGLADTKTNGSGETANKGAADTAQNGSSKLDGCKLKSHAAAIFASDETTALFLPSGWREQVQQIFLQLMVIVSVSQPFGVRGAPNN